ncbi:IS256 family transposase [Sphaerochaeta sp.]|uniref:IS256 family transposase n=1 Tax=Sphaerochaeta sp. TaxID=1972642 RepID=UPI002FC64C2C
MTDSNSTKELEKKLLSFITEEDPMLCMLQWITEKFMEIEVANKVGAQKGKHSAERNTHLSGSRVRRFDTRMGTMYLTIPKLRKGGYVPFFVTAKKRSEQALMQIIQEAWVSGISTRKIERLAKSMGIEQISASQVSAVNKELDAMVDEFRDRPLQEEYPILWIDALYEKIRENGHVEHMAVLGVKGIGPDGTAQILAIEPMHNESEETYRILFQNLKGRGVKRVWLCISDAHKGLQAAIRKEFTGTSWQRCKVHFMRNILAHVGHRHKDSFAKQLKHIWLQPDERQARSYAESLMQSYEEQFPDAIRCLEEGLEDSLQFYRFDQIDHRKISSSNTLERLNREIRRRSKVVGIFPNKLSYIRLITTYLIEYEEEWQSGRAYVSVQSLTEQRLKLEEVA